MRPGTKMRLSAIEGRLVQLECPHKTQGFNTMYRGGNLFEYGPAGGSRTCKDCGKVLEFYADHESFLAAKLEHAEEAFINLRQELDKERAASDRKAKKAKA